MKFDPINLLLTVILFRVFSNKKHQYNYKYIIYSD